MERVQCGSPGAFEFTRAAVFGDPRRRYRESPIRPPDPHGQREEATGKICVSSPRGVASLPGRLAPGATSETDVLDGIDEGVKSGRCQNAGAFLKDLAVDCSRDC